MISAGQLGPSDDEEKILRVEDLVVQYRARGARSSREIVQAVSGVSFDVRAGETLGLVGESGCGKSTTARAVAMLRRPDSGRVLFEGRDLTELSSVELRHARSKLQIIFQDPLSSLNPQRRVRDIVAEGLAITKQPKPWDETVQEVLVAVGLDPETVSNRRPRELSGGQCQRVAVARALVLKPRLLICDEPISALDVSIQAQILNLLEDMKLRYSLTILFIAHDLAVVRHVSDRVAVMYLGKLCELATPEALFQAPRHPYTAALLSAIPIADPHVPLQPARLQGDVPSPINPPSGCRFRTRCEFAQGICSVEEPPFRELRPGHLVACHFPLRAATPLDESRLGSINGVT